MAARTNLYIALHHGGVGADCGVRKITRAGANPYNAPMDLKICLIGAEVAPFSKTGGLADVCGALTKYLQAAGHDARVFTPLYDDIDRTALEHHPVEGLQDVPLQFGAHRYHYSLIAARVPGTSGHVYFIDCPILYARGNIYTTDPDEHLRYIALTRAAIECCQRMGFGPQILHAHDWHAAFAPLYLKAVYESDPLFKRTRSVLTIHNIGYQGVFAAGAVADVGLGARTGALHQDDLRAGHINSLKHGIMYADAITTVSPTYAVEIRTDEYGMGLQSVLRARGAALSGILNGVDYDEWDPRSDRYLPRHYDPAHLQTKAALKQEFLERLHISVGARAPLVGLVGRMAAQKGYDLMFDALPHALTAGDFALVALGSGEPRYEEFFASLQQGYPGRVFFQRGYSDELAHWIEAASDLFLMPSLYEPCGLNQMYSLRYGTVPLVRRTGGLADTVEHYDRATRRGTGIVFDDFSAAAFAQALQTALTLYGQRGHWRQLVANGMSQDFSWARQGAHYVELYERLARSATEA
jgi:starch synthase